MPKGDREILKADIEDGYTTIANLLIEALAYSTLSGKQIGICLFVIRKTYGWDRKDAEITLSEFAQACGSDESYISKQLKQLIKLNVVVRTNYQPGKTPTYSLNTRVAQWDKGCLNVQGLTECAKQGLYKQTRVGLSKCARVVHIKPVGGVGEAGSLQPDLKKDYKKKDIYSVFDHWNSKNIIKHRELTQAIQSAINARLEHYSTETLLEAIDNYAFVLESEEHFFSYKWPIKDFLNPRNLDRFLSESNPLSNFKKDKPPPQTMPKAFSGLQDWSEAE